MKLLGLRWKVKKGSFRKLRKFRQSYGLLIKLTLLIVAIIAWQRFVQIDQMQIPDLPAEDQSQVQLLLDLREEKERIIASNFRQLVTTATNQQKAQNAKLALMAFSQWMHLVILQNQVDDDPNVIKKFRTEMPLYKTTRLFEITIDQGKEIQNYRGRELDQAWANFKNMNWRQGWESFEAGLRLVALQAQTNVNPKLQHLAQTTGKRENRVLQWRAEIVSASQKYDLEPALIAAVIEQESGGNANAISPAGAVGLMQLMPDTARELGVNPFDPKENIEGGTKYLKKQLQRFGNLEDALVAYNAGPSRVGRPMFRETAGYVQTVPRLLAKYRPLLNNQGTIDIKPWLPTT